MNDVSRALELKQSLSRTSIKKYQAFLDKTSDDGRLRGSMLYHGATTGRWASTGNNLQNISRPAIKHVDSCIELLKLRDYEALELVFDDATEALVSCTRAMIKAPAGKVLYVADYASIEARVLAWLAGQNDTLEVFRGHGKIYEHAASQIYRVPVEQVDKEQRFVGKTAVLSLGYQGGPNAFIRMGQAYGVDIDAALAQRVVSQWRGSNKAIVKFWYDIETAAIDATLNPLSTLKVRGVKFRSDRQFLFCQLPSGRLISYPYPKVVDDQLHFMGADRLTRKWSEQTTYGGDLVQSITQATARDLLAAAMLRLEAAGYAVVMSVHDEIVTEAPEDFGSVAEFCQLMCQLPEWAKGLPVSAEGYKAARYRK